MDSPRKPSHRQKVGAAVLGGALFLGGAAAAEALSNVAGAQDSTTTTAPSNSAGSSGDQQAPSGPHTANGVTETPLTGTDLDKATAAANAAVPGATVVRAETDADGATYEVHMTKDDGSNVTVKLDADFNVTGTESGGPGGRDGGHGGPGGGGPHTANGLTETPLTGSDLEKATAAANAAVPGGTVERAETDADGAAYEVHMTDSNGNHVTVELDQNFHVTGTQQGR